MELKFNINGDELCVDTSEKLLVLTGENHEWLQGIIPILEEQLYRQVQSKSIYSLSVQEQLSDDCCDMVELIEEIDSCGSSVEYVVIELPEATLPPTRQKTLIEELQRKFPDKFFIIMTYSPLILNSIRSQNLVIVKEDGYRMLGFQIYGTSSTEIYQYCLGIDELPSNVAELTSQFYEFMEKFPESAIKAREVLDKLESLIGRTKSELECSLKLEKIRHGLE